MGAVLALVGLGAALTAGAAGAALRGGRLADPLARDVAAAALAGFAYWVVHGSFDWFWEFAGLGAPAFALLGLACALAPARRRPLAEPPAGDREPPAQAPPPSSRGRPAAGRLIAPRSLGLLAGALLALAAALSLAAPWLSQLQVQRAARIWPVAPQKAYSRLADAARLNPLSDQSYLVAGGIALRLGELGAGRP